ncbi:hypothetical protein GCM10027053_23320 [Intrasporangium mesophilum]
MRGRRQPHDVPIGSGIGDPWDELVELRGMHDRGRPTGCASERLLRCLCGEVAAFQTRKPLGAHNGQRDMMIDSGLRPANDRVGGRAVEELVHGGLNKVAGIGQIHQRLDACRTEGDDHAVCGGFEPRTDGIR